MARLGSRGRERERGGLVPSKANAKAAAAEVEEKKEERLWKLLWCTTADATTATSPPPSISPQPLEKKATILKESTLFPLSLGRSFGPLPGLFLELRDHHQREREQSRERATTTNATKLFYPPPTNQ